LQQFEGGTALFQTINLSAFAECNSLEKFTFPCLSSRLREMSSIGRGEIEQQISNTDNFQVNDGELAITEPPRFQRVRGKVHPEVEDWFAARRKSLRKVCELIERNELKDVTAIVDLAFWKMGIMRAEGEGMNADDREALRIDVPGPARAVIVSLL